MKKSLKFFSAFLVLALLFIGIWLGVNRWPRQMEPTLYTEEDLTAPLTEKPGQNAYEYLRELKGDKYEEADILHEATEEALNNLPDFFWDINFANSPAEVEAFWKQARDLQPQLADFVKARRQALESTQHLLKFSQIIDRDEPDYEKQRADWVALRDMNRLGKVHLVERINQGDVETAYDFWLQLFQLNRSHLFSARGLISHFVATANVTMNLEMLSLLRAHLPPPQIQNEINRVLKEWDPRLLNMRRVLAMEYLFQVQLPERLRNSKEEAFWFRQSFNPALYLRDVNERFRALDQLDRNPDMITREALRNLEMDLNKKTYKGLWWWFYNPAGKMLLRLVSVNLTGNLQRFHESKTTIEQMRAQLLDFPQYPEPGHARSVYPPEMETKGSAVTPTYPRNEHPFWQYLDRILEFFWIFLVYLMLLVWLTFAITKGIKKRKKEPDKRLNFPFFSGLILWGIIGAWTGYGIFIVGERIKATFPSIFLFSALGFLLLLSLVAIRIGQQSGPRPFTAFRIALLITLILPAGLTWSSFQHSQEKTFQEAASKGNITVVKKFLKKGWDPDFRRDRMDFTPLMRAIRGGHLDTAKLLIQSGANINATAAGQTSALFWAIQRENKPAVKLLLENGADFKTGSPEGPLDEFAKETHPGIYHLILEYEQDRLRAPR